MRGAIICLLILFTACAQERRTIGKGWVAQRDNRPQKERHVPERLQPRSIEFEQPTAPEPQPIADASSAPPSGPALDPSLLPTEAVEDRINESAVAKSSAVADPQPLQQELPERTRWNWWAPISTLVLIGGLAWAISLQSTELLIVFGAISFIIALISARQCRDKGLKGQGFALITMYLAGVTFLVGVLAFIGRFR